ncbi:hypothetical protein ACJX0J_034353, partial [Zea mays]
EIHNAMQKSTKTDIHISFALPPIENDFGTEDGDVLDFTLEETTIHTPISNIFSIDLNYATLFLEIIFFLLTNKVNKSTKPCWLKARMGNYGRMSQK